MYKVEIIGTIQTIRFHTAPPHYYLTLTVLAEQQNRFGNLITHWVDCTIHDQMALEARPYLQESQYVYIEGIEDHFPFIGKKGKFAGLPTFKKKVDVFILRLPMTPGLEFHKVLSIKESTFPPNSPTPNTPPTKSDDSASTLDPAAEQE